MSRLGIGIVGFGFMGRTHLEAYRRAQADQFDCQVKAVFSLDPPDFGGQGNVDTGTGDGVDLDALGIRWTPQIEQLLEADDVDLISICTPTDTHIDLAIEALEQGKHVLLEKPVALSSSEVQRLVAVDARTDRLCMPAMCMRFWPGWSWLRETVQSGELGPVKSAYFQRIGAAPGWSQDFYLDEKRSGGALMDLHVHDADFVMATFGVPDEVSTSGTRSQLITQYRYPDGPSSVVAEAAWYPDPSYPFQMRYRIGFADAVADFDLSRGDQALHLYRGGDCQVIDLPVGNGYDGEIRHLLQAISEGADKVNPDLIEARGVLQLVEAEGQSIDDGRAVKISIPR
ncbi:MAG: Gfo/Idh/MocA family oxidoreductase [Planctomycetota bacterium]|nr:Gfo/Idh/MocA family oxidoreductase [Planctomycetota bacterium]